MQETYHGRGRNGNLDDFALGRVNQGLQVLEVLDLDRLVVASRTQVISVLTCKLKDENAHVILPVTASEGGL